MVLSAICHAPFLARKYSGEKNACVKKIKLGALHGEAGGPAVNSIFPPPGSAEAAPHFAVRAQVSSDRPSTRWSSARVPVSLASAYCFAPTGRAWQPRRWQIDHRRVRLNRGGLGAFNHDQVIVLALEAGCGKVRGAGAQQPPVDLIALEVHRIAGLISAPSVPMRSRRLT